MNPRNRSDSLRPFRNLFYFGFFNLNSWLIALGTPMVIFAGELGASSFQIGLAYSFVFTLLPIQILSTATLHRFGYKKQMIFGWSMRSVFLVIPLFLVWLRPEEPQPLHVYALLLFVFLFALFRSIGNSAVMPWYYALLPDHIRGKFFSFDQTFYAVAGILSLLYCALLFEVLSLYDAFLYLYLTCALASITSIYFLNKVPDVEKPDPTHLKTIFKLAPSYCLVKGKFRQYLGFVGIYNLIQTTIIPLITYYLQIELGMPLSQIMYLTAIQYLGAIVGAQLIGKKVDRIGVKPIFKISLIINSLLLIFWSAHTQGFAIPSGFLFPAYLLFGVSTTIWATANLKYLPRVCSDEKQALAVSVHSSIVGVIAGLSPIFWGFFVKQSDGIQGINTNAFSLFFLIAIATSLALFFYVPKLTSEGRHLPSIQMGSYLVRPYRYLSNLVSIDLLKSDNPNKKKSVNPRSD